MCQNVKKFLRSQIWELVISTPGFVAKDLSTMIQNAYCLSAKKKYALLKPSTENDENSVYENFERFVSELSDVSPDFESLLQAAHELTPASHKAGLSSVPDIKWSDIGAMQNIKNELNSAVFLALKHPEICSQLNVKMSSGIILEGPPGCGKTLLAKALANQAGVNFISIKGPEIISQVIFY